MEDTIVGIATAAGEGGVAIVRVSGPEAVRLFEQAFRPRGARPPYESHRLMVGHAMDETGPIDEAMGVVMYAPGPIRARTCVKSTPTAVRRRPRW